MRMLKWVESDWLMKTFGSMAAKESFQSGKTDEKLSNFCLGSFWKSYLMDKCLYHFKWVGNDANCVTNEENNDDINRDPGQGHFSLPSWNDDGKSLFSSVFISTNDERLAFNLGKASADAANSGAWLRRGRSYHIIISPQDWRSIRTSLSFRWSFTRLENSSQAAFVFAIVRKE